MRYEKKKIFGISHSLEFYSALISGPPDRRESHLVSKLCYDWVMTTFLKAGQWLFTYRRRRLDNIKTIYQYLSNHFTSNNQNQATRMTRAHIYEMYWYYALSVTKLKIAKYCLGVEHYNEDPPLPHDDERQNLKPLPTTRPSGVQKAQTEALLVTLRTKTIAPACSKEKTL